MGWTAGRLWSSERGEADVHTASMAEDASDLSDIRDSREQGEITPKLGQPSVA